MGSSNFFDKHEAHARISEAIGVPVKKLHFMLMAGFDKKQYTVKQDTKNKNKWIFSGTEKARKHHRSKFNKLGWSVISTINFIQGKNKPKMSN